MTVLVQVREAVAARVAAALPHVELITIPHDTDLPAGVRGQVLLTVPWGSPNLSQVLVRGVHWIHVLGTGVDAFPLHLLTDQVLTCSRGGSAVPIAEWVLAMMLAFEKHLPEAWIHDAPPTGWHRDALGTLHGKTLGLVGFGGIGSAVAARAQPFGMRICAYRRTGAAPPMAGVDVLGSLSALVAMSDHVVIAAPLTPTTRHLFNAEIFAAMKPGVHLVNVARGGLIDHEALRAALADGRVARASLDAVEPEPLPPGHWLYSHPRVRLSPHISWSMPDAADWLIQPFIDNLRRYEAGTPLQGVVDRDEGY